MKRVIVAGGNPYLSPDDLAHYRSALDEFLITSADFGAPVGVTDPIIDSQMKTLTEIMRRIMALEGARNAEA